MTKKLEKLTPEQEAMLPAIRDEWIKHGLSTEPADRKAAEEGVRKAYIAAGLESPKIVVWLDSPLAGAIGQYMVREFLKSSVGVSVRVSIWVSVRDSIWDSVRDSVWDSVWDSVGASVRDSVGASVGASVRYSVRDSIWDSVRDSIWDSVRDSIWDSVRDSVRDSIGMWDTGWIAHYKTFQQFGIDTSKIDGLAEVEKSAGWWWPLAGAVVITDRPSIISQDKEGRLHNETGPSVLYRDGFAVYSWHGTRVPADLIEKGWTAPQILQEDNSEIRRCAIEKMGWPEFLHHSNMKRIGASVPDPGNHPFELSLYDLPDEAGDLFDQHARVLVCTNGSEERDGTRHQFGLIVPGHHIDPVAAAAELYNVPRDVYASLQVRK